MEFLSYPLAKPGKSPKQNKNQVKIRQAFNILINLEKNKTIGWKNVRFAVRQNHCSEIKKRVEWDSFFLNFRCDTLYTHIYICEFAHIRILRRCLSHFKHSKARDNYLIKR